MTNKNFKRIFILLSVTFIFFSLAAKRVFAQVDTADVRIISTTSYPGRFAEVEVKLKNPMEISGFQFRITLSNHELIDFHTESIGVDTILIPVDTCTWEPDTLHGDTCFVDSLIPTPVRYCYIDTVGSLISDFEYVECHGDTGDTSLPYCKGVEIFGMAQHSNPIPADPNYRLLFKFGVDLFCLPDSTTDRTALFLISPSGFSFLSDPEGYVVPFRYHRGGLTAWWGIPGDANADSIIDLGDIVYLITYLYRSGSPPCIPETGDANGDCEVELGDVVYLIQYLYRGGSPPVPGCWYGKKEE
jgi:hypothetical protein